MAVFPDSILIEFYNGSAWVNISAYVVGDMRVSYGLGGWQPEKRVAVLGSANIVLNNKAKLFTPMGGDVLRGLNTLSGWTRGARIRIRILWHGTYYTCFIGRIASIDSDDKNFGPEQTRVFAVDWMQIPANYPMKSATIATNQTIDTALALILARLSLQPEATDFDAGVFTFPAIFDNVRNRTMASAELLRLANSELGYIYLKGNGTLRAENYLARSGARALDTVLLPPDVDDYLLLEDGGHLLLEDGGRLILNNDTTSAVALYSDAESFNIVLDQNSVLNSAIIRAFPPVTDTSLKVLYSLGVPLYIAGKATVQFSAHYTDPNGQGQIAGTNMQTPASTTDYTANTQAGGGGTDKTAQLTVTATYYGDRVEYTLVNADNSGYYVTKLQARGYGIYYGNSLETTIEDAASIAAYGLSGFQFDQKYQKNSFAGDIFGGSIVEEYKSPKSRITKLSYLANLNKNHMASFLQLDIGSLIRIIEDRSVLSNHYYITDRAFTIRQGGIIKVDYGVKENDSFISGGLAPLAIDFAGSAATDGINFGYLQQLDNLDYISISAWIWIDTAPGSSPAKSYKIVSRFAGPVAGWQLDFNTDLKLNFDIYMVGGAFRSRVANTALTLNAWRHVVITRDNRVATNNAIIYYDGSAVGGTTGNNGTDPLADDMGANLIIGNKYTVATNYTDGFDGKIFDVRIYNRVLSASEVSTLYNSGTPDLSLVPSGLLFEGMGGYSELGSATDRAGETLDSSDAIIENVLRALGTPHGSPVIRATP